MSRILTMICRPRVSIPLCVIVLAMVLLIGFLLTMPRAHDTISENTFAQIRARHAARPKLRSLPGGPPRIETSRPDFDVPHSDVKERWGHYIPSRFLSESRATGFDRGAKRKPNWQRNGGKHSFDICEDGHYLVCWHHDLATITVVFDENTDRVKGAGLWTPREKTWREYPPMRLVVSLRDAKHPKAIFLTLTSPWPSFVS